jgi:hypothetical protein
VAEHPARKTGWRGYLAPRVWPWVVLAWAIPALLSLLLVRILGQDWLWWFLAAVWAVAPVVSWWVRGRGREPAVGFFAIVWLLGAIEAAVEINGVTVADIVTELWVLLLFVAYWPSWAWLYKLRKLPSVRIGEADKLGISIFLVTGAPGFAASIAGPDAVKQWGWLVVGFLVTLLWTIGLVVAGTKGPALVKELQEQVKDIRPSAVPWVRFYSEPSVIIAVSFGFIAFMLTFQSVVPNWLSSWLGVMYFFVVVLLQRLLMRLSKKQTPSGQTRKDLPEPTPQLTQAEGPDTPTD